MTNRRGVSLAEAMVVTCLFGVVLAAFARAALAHGRLAARVEHGARVQEVVRTAELVLGAELRMLTDTDLSVGADSIRIRAFRGSGPVCGVGAGQPVVRYRGIRRPDPGKDSVLLVDDRYPSGRAVALLAVGEAAGCGLPLRLGTGPRTRPGGFVLVFETGSYHLAEQALRYRRGASGRQALTEELADRGRFRDRGPRGIEALFTVRARPGPDGLAQDLRLSAPLLNRETP